MFSPIVVVHTCRQCSGPSNGYGISGMGQGQTMPRTNHILSLRVRYLQHIIRTSPLFSPLLHSVYYSSELLTLYPRIHSVAPLSVEIVLFCLCNCYFLSSANFSLLLLLLLSFFLSLAFLSSCLWTNTMP